MFNDPLFYGSDPYQECKINRRGILCYKKYITTKNATAKFFLMVVKVLMIIHCGSDKKTASLEAVWYCTSYSAVAMRQRSLMTTLLR